MDIERNGILGLHVTKSVRTYRTVSPFSLLCESGNEPLLTGGVAGGCNLYDVQHTSGAAVGLNAIYPFSTFEFNAGYQQTIIGEVML